ncbi:MAG: hypothetical protein PUB96_01485, partial [Helicobacteraceae bacterium]|nr:hypothetical protein [Helicobacteraceae bacterium]
PPGAGRPQHRLTLGLGIPGERRLWLNQYDGIPNLLKNLSLYFPKIRVFIDGMTAYDNERIKVVNNLEAFNKIKNGVDKLKLDITLKSLSGYDYRTKLCYCSMCDLAISDVGTTSLTPFELGDKPGVAFCPNNIHFINHAKAIISTNIRKMVDVKYLQNADTGSKWLFDFFIPWQHFYNLAAEVIENIKSSKMHRLEVPPVSMVAEIYYLKEKQKELESLKMELKTTLANPKAANKILKNKNLELKNKKLELEIGALNKSLQIPIYIKEKDSAKARVTNYLGYKLGAAMILNSKSLMGIIRMPFVLSYIADKHNLEQKHYKRQIAKNPNLKRLPLESLSDHKEGLKFKQHLSYKLGEAFLKAKKTWYKGGLIKFCFVAKKLAKVHKNSIKTNRDI